MFINVKKKRLLTFLASKRKEKIETFFNISNKGKSFLTKLNSPNLKMLVNFYKRKENLMFIYIR